MAKVEILDQAKTFFGKLSRTQLMIMIAAVLVVAGGIVYLITSSDKTEMAVLYSSLDEADAAKIVEKLKEKKIPYEIQDNGSKILVDKNQLYDTRLSFASEGLPETGVVGYEIFDRANLGMSEAVQKINYRRALEGELTRTIGSIDEIKKVRVHIVIPDKTLFEKDQKNPTASVSLHLKSGRSLSRISIEGIQNLVASSVEGMVPGGVTVVDQRGKILSEIPNDTKSVGGLTATQHEQQMKVEQYLTDKVQSLLDGVLGQGNSEVRVNAELDFTQSEKTITDYDPDRAVPRSQQIVSQSDKNSDSVAYTQVNKNRVVTYPNSNREVSNSNEINNYEISSKVERIVSEVGDVKRLSIAVLINGTIKPVGNPIDKKFEYEPRSDEEIGKLTQVVKNAVGFDSTRNDQVSVINVPFDTNIQETIQTPVEETIWWKDPDNIKLILLVAVMFSAIFLMYRLLQSRQVKERMRIAMSLPEHVKIEEDEDDEPEEELEEIDFGADDLLLLPAELPEQLLLEGQTSSSVDSEPLELESGGSSVFDKKSLADKAKADLDMNEMNGLNEDTFLRLEIKGKVQDYVDGQTNDAVRLVRILLAQDFDEKSLKF